MDCSNLPLTIYAYTTVDDAVDRCQEFDRCRGLVEFESHAVSLDFNLAKNPGMRL